MVFIKRNWLRLNEGSNRWLFLISVLFLICFMGCDKDPAIPGSEDCFDIPPPQGLSVGYQYKQPQFGYLAPCFNPNNPNEVVYVKGDIINQVIELRKRNLVTGEDIYLINNIWEHPNWGVNDWILFNHADNQHLNLGAAGCQNNLHFQELQGLCRIP